MSGALNARSGRRSPVGADSAGSSSSSSTTPTSAYPPRLPPRGSTGSPYTPSSPASLSSTASTKVSPAVARYSSYQKSPIQPPPTRPDGARSSSTLAYPNTSTSTTTTKPISLFGGSSLFSASNLAAKALKGVDYVNQNTKTYRSAISSAGSILAAQSGLVEPQPEAKEKTWGEWAREWRGKDGNVKLAEDGLHLMPGWATYMPRKVGESETLPNGVVPFDLHVTTAGFTSSLRGPENATRSQKVFMRIAKSFAALPRLPTEIPDSFGTVGEQLTDSPASTPLNEEPLIINHNPNSPELLPQNNQPRNRPRSNTMASVSSTQSNRSASTDPFFKDMSDEKLRLLHTNLDTRLQPFWASVSQRRIQLSIYTVPLPHTAQRNHPKWHLHIANQTPEPGPDDEPLVRNVFMTTPQGHWNQKVVIPWERIVSHGPSLKLAFAKPPAIPEDLDPSEPPAMNELFALYIKVELLSDQQPNRPTTSVAQVPPGTPPVMAGSMSEEPKPIKLDKDKPSLSASASRVSESNTYFSAAVAPAAEGTGGQRRGLTGVGDTTVVATILTPIGANGGIRVVSDLDDTVKVSNILSGAREVFRNAFCLPIDEVAAPGMSKFYRDLSNDGVSGFHYVSNSPFELLPILTEFFKIHAFPSGFSLRLKYYGGRNLMNGLFEPPGERKRPGLVEIFDAFPQAKFILFGDSGEQDLELYVAMAKERPHQILAVAIRDVTTAFTASIQNQLKRTSGTATPTTPTRPNVPRQVTASEIDLKALTEALQAEGAATSTSDLDGVEQASTSGIGGRARDVARKAMGVPSKLDLKRFKLTDGIGGGDGGSDSVGGVESENSSASESGQRTPTTTNSSSGKRSSREESIKAIGSGSGPGSTTSVQTTSRAASPERTKNPTEIDDSNEINKIEKMGVAGSASIASGPMTDELALTKEEMQTKEEMNALTTQQLKLVRRAAEWNVRRKRAMAEIPEGVKLLFFAEPGEVEVELREMVRRESKGHVAVTGGGGGIEPVASANGQL